MNNMLSVRHLSKSYGAFALRDATFSLPQGYVMGFVGSNGAGKTTTIKLILGMVKADSGSIEAPDRAEIGVVMDAPLYVEEWTLSDVEAALAPFYRHWDAGKFAGYLKQFGLDAKMKVKTLSRGMKVKLQIAVALSHNAKLLILDEPTSGLDPVARDEIADLIRAFVSDADHSVFFSTHITPDLDKTADYITFIMDGRVMFTGEKDALLAQYRRVTGGLKDVNETQKKQIIGYRAHGSGFEGMVEAAQARQLARDVLVEPVTLDEIIIFMNKGVAIDA